MWPNLEYDKMSQATVLITDWNHDRRTCDGMPARITLNSASHYQANGLTDY